MVLKITEPEDAAAIFAVTDQNRDYLRTWLPWLDNTKEVTDTTAFIKKNLEHYAKHEGLQVAILFEDKIVGVASFNSINWSNKTTDIGYWLAKDYQGKGIMTRVVRALTGYAFNHFKVNKVEIRAAVSNKASQGVAERLGYTKEGTIRQAEILYGQYVDHVVYGMLATEWQ